MAGPFETDRRRGNPRPGVLRLELLCLATALGYVAVADPHDRSVPIPRCPIKLVSGWDCPACGGMRVAHDLLHGDVRRALRDNLFLVVASPLLLYLLYRRAVSLRTGERYEAPARISYGLLTAAVVWGVVRNLPVWPWRHPKH